MAITTNPRLLGPNEIYYSDCLFPRRSQWIMIGLAGFAVIVALVKRSKQNARSHEATRRFEKF